MKITEQEEDWFWKLIDKSRNTNKNIKLDKQINNLSRELKKLEPHQIIKFDSFFQYFLNLSYSWDLWGAAYIINGGCSDDTFDYFRSWLIGQGKVKFYKSITNPEQLLDFINPKAEYEWEGLEYCAPEAYEQLVGSEIDSSKYYSQATVDNPKSPKGTEWKETELANLFPKLWNAFSRHRQYDDITETNAREVETTSIAVSFVSSDVPPPEFWKDILLSMGHNVTFRIFGCSASIPDQIPYPDYSSYLIQLEKRITKNDTGILVKDISKYQNDRVNIVFELYDSEISKVFQDLSMCIAKFDDSKINSGNCEFTGDQWITFLKSGELPQ